MAMRPRSRGSVRAGLAMAVALALGVTLAAAKKPKGKPGGGKHGPVASMPAPAPKPSTEPPKSIALPAVTLERVTLDNGLRVVLSPDPRATSVAVTMTYDVGARNEDRGSSGLASLLEKLLFQGSANVRRGEHVRLLEGRGGEASSRTTPDTTQLTDVAPSSELPLLLWLEADRLKSLQIKDDAVDAQLEALAAEAKLADLRPLAAARARARELVYQAFFPYEHAPIATLADLPQLKADAARSFYEGFFAPNLAVLSIAGDFEVDHAVSLVHRFFDTAKKQDKTTPFVLPQLPEQTSQRTSVLEDPKRKAAAFVLAWSAPPLHTEDHDGLVAALDALAGESGRLAQKLVIEKGWAESVRMSVGGLRGPDLVTLEVVLLDDAPRADAEKLVEAEVDGLAKTGPTDGELARYRQGRERAAWDALSSTERRSAMLGEFELSQGDARGLAAELTRSVDMSRERVRAAAARYLSPSRRTLVEVLPPKSATEAPKKLAPAPMSAPPKKASGKPGKRPRG
jgi:predicted Zn-dependent peptidase